MSEQQGANQPLTVRAEPDDLKGVYANAISVTSQERDVVIDFFAHVRVNGQNDQASLVSRVFLNRFTAQDLVDILKRTIDQWEKMRYETRDGAVPPATEQK